MEDKKKEQLFEIAPIPQAVMTLAIPTILSSLVMVLYNLADTYFVGMLNDPVQNAAVTLAAPVLLAFNAINNLFGVGSSSMMSRALGRKDYETVRRSSAFGFYGALTCGVLFSLAFILLWDPALRLLGVDADTVQATGGYLFWTVVCGAAPAILNVVMANLVRSEGAAFHASVGTMSGCLLNIVLDPIFIMPWGLGMGAAGAGLATFLSNCAACLYFFALLFIRRGRTYVCVNPRAFRLSREIVAGVCGVGIPAAIQNLLNVTGMTVLNNFTSGYGSAAVAAMGIAQRINMVSLYIALGLSQGVMPLLSYNFGSGNIRRLKETLLFCLKLSVSVMILSSAGCFLGAERLVSLFMENGEIVALGGSLLQGMCLAIPFLCVDFLAVGVFQACGMGRRALVFAILRKIVLEIPALVVWNTVRPLYGLSYAQATAEVVMTVLAAFTLRKLFKELESQKHFQNKGTFC